MSNADIIAKVNATLIEEFEIPAEKLSPEATLFGETGLGLDSLDAIDMLVYIEEKFSVKLPGEIFKDVRTLGDIYRLVSEMPAASTPNENKQG